MNTLSADLDIVAMRRLRDGDDRALNEIMDRWQRRLTGYLLRAVGNEVIAVDLAQETFVRVYQSRDKYHPSSEFSTWLYAIATNLLRQHFRWLKRHPTVSMDFVEPGADDTPLSDYLSAEDVAAVEKNERAQIVKNAIAALPVELREATLLFEYADLSYEQIARIMGCSKKAVETRLYRARAILREKLTKWLIE